MADILTCQSRKCTGVITNNANSSIPWRCASFSVLVWIVAQEHSLPTIMSLVTSVKRPVLEWKGVTIIIISSTWEFPAITGMTAVCWLLSQVILSKEQNNQKYTYCTCSGWGVLWVCACMQQWSFVHWQYITSTRLHYTILDYSKGDHEWDNTCFINCGGQRQ